MPWKTDLTASGHPTTRGPTAVVGTYATTAGPTKPFKPNASDQSMLLTQLSTALAGVKSCTFDLTATGGTSIKVDLKQLSKATIKVDGTAVPLDTTSANGWNMINETTASAVRQRLRHLARSQREDDRLQLPLRDHRRVVDGGARRQPMKPTTRLTAVATIVVL